MRRCLQRPLVAASRLTACVCVCPPSGCLPALRTSQKETLSRPSDIIIHLRKQVGFQTDPPCLPSNMHFTGQVRTFSQRCLRLR